MNNVQPLLKCRVTMACVSLARVDSSNAKQDPHHYECSPVESGKVSDFSYVIDLPTDLVHNNAKKILAGTLFVNIPDGKVLNGAVVFPKKSNIRVGTAPKTFKTNRRRLEPTSGTASILVLRISSNDATPTLAAQEMYGYIFNNSQPVNQPSLASQYSAVSFGKLQFVPTHGGVAEVYVNMNANGAQINAVTNAAIAAAQSQFGVSSVTSLADHIMFCIPPGTGSWAGMSSVNSWRLVLNDGWCGYLSALMHEMGHNLGLLHSNQGGIQYMDFTSYMSAGYAAPYYPLKAFNGANNWQLGWYSDRQITVTPSNGGRVVTLATFADYGKANKSNPVLIKVGNDTFLQYNRAKAFNQQAQQDIDQTTIVQQQSNGTSLLGGIGPTLLNLMISNFDGSGQNLMIYVCSTGVGNANDPDWMVLGIGYGKNYCPARAPTPKPAKRPLSPRHSGSLSPSS